MSVFVSSDRFLALAFLAATACGGNSGNLFDNAPNGGGGAGAGGSGNVGATGGSASGGDGVGGQGTGGTGTGGDTGGAGSGGAPDCTPQEFVQNGDFSGAWTAISRVESIPEQWAETNPSETVVNEASDGSLSLFDINPAGYGVVQTLPATLEGGKCLRLSVTVVQGAGNGGTGSAKATLSTSSGTADWTLDFEPPFFNADEFIQTCALSDDAQLQAVRLLLGTAPALFYQLVSLTEVCCEGGEPACLR